MEPSDWNKLARHNMANAAKVAPLVGKEEYEQVLKDIADENASFLDRMRSLNDRALIEKLWDIRMSCVAHAVSRPGGTMEEVLIRARTIEQFILGSGEAQGSRSE